MDTTNTIIAPDCRFHYYFELEVPVPSNVVPLRTAFEAKAIVKHLYAVANATDVVTPEDHSPMMAERDREPFADLARPIREALEKRGFSELTAVQAAVLAAGAESRDLQISSQTGSGKTVALGLALAPRLIEAAVDGDRRLRVLVIVPTRELAVQVSNELRWLYASLSSVSVECVTGGSSVGQERRRLARKPTVVVGTPGRLNDHIRSHAIDCSRVAEVVLDEADRMLDMGFREELETILDVTPEDRSTHLVSATFPREIQRLARKYQNQPLAVEGTSLGAANEDIQHVGHVLRPHDRYAAIVNLLLLAQDQRTLVFVSTRSGASELAEQLVADGFAAAPISGELEQFQRTRTLEAFRSGTTTVLVATDVAARGLDIPEVSLVIHTDAPRDAESYTHRAGRTGRAGRKGRSVLLTSPQHRRKVDYLLGRAKLKMQWCGVPTAAEVERALAKRARRQLRASLAASPTPSEKQLSYAQALLEEADAPTVVARLVELCREHGKTAPRELSENSTTTWNERESYKPGPSRDRQQRRERSPRMRSEYFEINWGRRDGATPPRLVAMLCRRGDVTSRMIGAIDIDSRRTIFEVADSVAHRFEHSAGMPDSRDPDLVIRRARSNRR